jgi:lauroyl/myristoyl acyltransferase
VPSSTAPAVLKRYCDSHNIPCVIIYGTCVRTEDGRCTAHSAYLSKPFDQYADDTEILQELMDMSEKFIRKYPEQYLWFYKRFQYIAPDCPGEIRKRYPFYAFDPRPGFFRKQGEKK